MERSSLEVENVQPPLGFLPFPPLQLLQWHLFLSGYRQPFVHQVAVHLRLSPPHTLISESENTGTSAIIILSVEIHCMLQNHTINITTGLTGKTRLEQTTQSL